MPAVVAGYRIDSPRYVTIILMGGGFCASEAIQKFKDWLKSQRIYPLSDEEKEVTIDEYYLETALNWLRENGFEERPK